MSTKNEIIKLLSESETRKAIDVLLEVTRFGDVDIYQEIVLQSAKFEQYKKEQRKGTQDSSSQDIRLSRINNALIEITRKLPEGDLKNIKQPIGNQTVQKANSKKRVWLIALAVLVLLLIGSIIRWQWTSQEQQQDISAVRPDSSLITDQPMKKKDLTVNEVADPPAVKPSNGNSVSKVSKEISPAKKKAEILFDTITLILNDKDAAILIDDQKPVFISNNLNVKKIKIPKTAKKISLRTSTLKCTADLKALDEKIYQNQICN